ncbi:MAG: mechanosensitive ion channel domain-containing protein [Pseudomonadota bacterium]
MIARLLPAALAAALCILTGQVAVAQEAYDPIEAEYELEELQIQLDQTGIDEEGVRAVQARASSMRATAVACVRRAEDEAAQVSADLELLGDLSEVDVAEVLEQRGTLEVQADTLASRITACRLVILRAGQIVENSAEEYSRLSAKRLASPGRNALGALADLLPALPQYLRDIPARLIDAEKLASISGWRWIIIVATTFIGFVTGNMIRRYALPWADDQRGAGGEPAVSAVLTRAVANQAHLFLAGGAATLGLVSFARDANLDVFAVRLALSVLLFAIARALISWYTGPHSPGQGLTLMAEDTQHMVVTRLRTLVLALLLGFLIFGPDWLSSLPDERDLVVRSLLTVFLVTGFIWVVRLARLLPATRDRLYLLRLLLIVASIVAVSADLSGYRNLANYLLSGVFATLTAGLVLWTLLWLINQASEGIVYGRARLSYRMRGWLGIRPDSSSAELGWLRLVLSLALWMCFIVFLVWLWDTTGNAMATLRLYSDTGFRLSDTTTLIPIDIASGLATFGGIIALTAWIKARMEKQWLREMGMDIGSREALVTLAGYVGFVIATFVGLLVAGVNFAGFALVAGALSLGIGIGLQEIVANFVSGLVLLFERPIKSGDFVTVGSVEGTVRQIRIRSTEIETLNRQNVVVPNSELITNQVTNWVLRDPYGRLQIRVGVAYGSDTQKVKSILEELAAAHPEVITKGKVPAPRALFMQFGDSSLDFELRAWIRQIERRFQVTSDLNLAIDAAFRENGIEIPFPQRDLHVRSWAPPPPHLADGHGQAPPLEDDDSR